MKKFEFVEMTAPLTRIRVVGIGGGGCNAVDSMIDLGLTGVDFCNINTDMQALSLSKCPNKLHIGDDETAGMGAGGDPSVGERSAMKCKDQITEMLGDCDMVFIAAGLGGGTGTGAAPVVAEIAKSMGLLTVAIVTKPFSFEGPQRKARADQGLTKLAQFVDTKIVILNDKLIETVGAKTPILEAFTLVNRILAEAVHAISDLISVPGEINVDFMDVRSIMGETGGAVMGVGIGKGENRSTEAVKKACASPLQEKIVIEGAKGVLISITASPDVTLQEVNSATITVYEAADPEANIIFGLVIDPDLKDEMRVTIIATGFPDDVKTFQPQHPKKEKLVSPRTGLDLDAKLKSMWASNETPAEPAPAAAVPARAMAAPRTAEPVAAPAVSAPAPRRQETPAEPAEAKPAAPAAPKGGWGAIDTWEQPTEPAIARKQSAAPQTATVAALAAAPAEASPATPEPEAPQKPGSDRDEPAFLRRRRSLFE